MQIAGLPFSSDVDIEIDEPLSSLIGQQKEELLAMGCTPTAVHVSAPGVPPRFFFTFAPDKPSYQTRNLLASKQYDVGQQMGDRMLRFYASKRVSKGGGWSS